MTDKNSIRLLWRQGDSVAEIARKTGVSRDTVYKYRDMDDFSPEPLKARPVQAPDRVLARRRHAQRAQAAPYREARPRQARLRVRRRRLRQHRGAVRQGD